jgi:hypothetical protein
VISGFRYNTETATKICTYWSDVGSSDFKFERTALFRSPKGKFFIAGYGGALSRWSEQYGNNGQIGGEGLIPLDVDEARSFAELHADADTIAEFFDIDDA